MDDTRLMKRCPQWDTCSTPDCPLDPEYLQRGHSFEGEEKCRAQRPTRLRIVEEAAAEGVATVAALSYGGLTKREWQLDR
ncbi:MAG: hypothetical protein J7M38_00310, partial [Armatimonadetes bacterium]|nr:hypothetical protein [Armatimonadota bacterium]